jgi:2-succinyl-5-enolpyruvyl-6-hydroxy-3-cyclohexene-1-carboxylate synthase
VSALSSLDAARAAVDALLAGGVRCVVVCPGSRSAPLAYALAEAEGRGHLELVVRVDERVGAFTALGAALSSGRPAAVATTSGTAVGNLLPAVMEANHAEVPLVVLSADRPEELHGTGANQTTEQFDLFGEHVRFATSVAAGASPSSSVRTALSAATGALEGIPAGPVQLNLCFRDPLVPEPGWEPPAGGGWEPPPVQPYAYRRPPVAALGGLPPRRTVVLAGHGAGPLAEAFAAAHGLPLLAEPSSNARFGGHAVGPYRLLLDGHPGLRIERVVLFGRPTLSRPVTALLARDGVQTALYHPRPVAWFREGRRRERLVDDLDILSGFAGRGAEGWLDSWLLAGAAAQEAVDRIVGGPGAPLTGPRLAQLVWESARGQLLLGSSNGIRDVDLAAAPPPQPAARVFANRGLSGIDGTVSTATGLWLGRRTETTAFLGDLTFLHDAGGLLLGDGEAEPDLRAVVLNDAGGAIFGLLEHGRVGDAALPGAAAAVERLFGTPHRADLRALAAAYGVRHTLVRTAAEASAALGAPRRRGREIIEARVDRASLRDLHERIRLAVGRAVSHN